MARWSALLISLSLAALWAADTGRGVELYNKGDYAQAIAPLREAVQANPEDAPALRYLGLAILESGGSPEEASGHITKARELDPDGSRLAMARLQVALKEYDAAEELLKECDCDDAGYVEGQLRLQQQRFKEAADKFETFLKSNSGHAYAHYYAGLAYNGLRRQDRMLTHFELFLRMKPDAPEARKVRAVLKTGR